MKIYDGMLFEEIEDFLGKAQCHICQEVLKFDNETSPNLYYAYCKHCEIAYHLYVHPERILVRSSYGLV